MAIFHATSRTVGNQKIKVCPTCSHPIDETPCIHVRFPENFTENEDGLFVENPNVDWKASLANESQKTVVK